MHLAQGEGGEGGRRVERGDDRGGRPHCVDYQPGIIITVGVAEGAAAIKDAGAVAIPETAQLSKGKDVGGPLTNTPLG